MPRQPKPWRRAECGGAWYAWVKKTREWLAPPEASKTEAQAVLNRKLADAAREARQPPGGLTVREVFNLFLGKVRAGVARQEYARVTLDRYLDYLDDAEHRLGRIPADQLRPMQVVAWLDSDHPDWGVTSRFNGITAVKAAVRWAWKQGHIPGNPLAGMERPQPRIREDIPTADQVEAILAKIRDRQFGEFIRAMVETGARPAELMGLTAEGIDLAQGVWTVRNKTARKTGETTRRIFLTPAMVELSQRLVAEHPSGPVFRNTAGTAWTRHTIAHRMERLATALGMGPEACVYALRHAFATRALLNGVPIATVATLMGHVDTKMVSRIYSKLHLEQDHLRDAVVRANPTSGDGEPAPPR